MEGSRTCRIYNKMENKARVVIDGGQKVKLSNQSILSPLYLEMVQKWKKQKQKNCKEMIESSNLAMTLEFKQRRQYIKHYYI